MPTTIDLSYITKDINFYKILQRKDFTLEDFNNTIKSQYRDPINPDNQIIELSESSNTKYIKISIPNEIINNNNHDILFYYIRNQIYK